MKQTMLMRVAAARGDADVYLHPDAIMAIIPASLTAPFPDEAPGKSHVVVMGGCGLVLRIGANELYRAVKDSLILGYAMDPFCPPE